MGIRKDTARLALRVAVLAIALDACAAPAGITALASPAASVTLPTLAPGSTPTLSATDQLATPSGGPASSTSPAPASHGPSTAPRASTTPGPSPSVTRRPLPTDAATPGGGGSVAPPVAIPTSGGPWLVGVATASPVCPVERLPPDPACAPRPVAGATVVVLDPLGQEVARATTGADGTFLVSVPAGHLRVEAAPVAGLMGAPPPIDAIVPSGAGAWAQVALVYDTGIR